MRLCSRLKFQSLVSQYQPTSCAFAQFKVSFVPALAGLGYAPAI